MEYELAKRLKDAGFPQKERSIIVGNEDSFVADMGHLDQYFYIPTLEELIEACGEDFRALFHKVKIGGKMWNWCAEAFLDDEYAEYGDTPSIAVANLWLSLHTKN